MSRLAESNIRVEIDDRNEKMGYKIRAAQTKKIPYMLVIGDKEAQSGGVSVHNRFQGDEGAQSLESFLEKIEGLILSRGSSAVRPGPEFTSKTKGGCQSQQPSR